MAPAFALAQESRPVAQGPRRAVLVFEAEGAPCFEETDFQGRVAAQLGYRPFVEGASRRIRLVAGGRDGGLRVRIELDAPERETAIRELEGRSQECERLRDATALVVAIAVDPDFVPPAASPSSEPAPSEPAPSEPAPSEPAPSEPAPASPAPEPAFESAPPESAPFSESAESERLRVGLAFGLTGSLGASPSLLSAGGRVGVELRRGALLFGLGLRGDLPGDTGFEGGRVEAHVVAGELAVCGQWEQLRVCLVGVLGVLRGRGQGFSTEQEVVLAYGALGGRLGLVVPLSGPLSFRASLDLLAHLAPVELVVDDDVAWKMPAAAAVLGAGLAFEFE